MVKTALPAPTPSAISRMTAREKPGRRISLRAARRSSSQIAFMSALVAAQQGRGHPTILVLRADRVERLHEQFLLLRIERVILENQQQYLRELVVGIDRRGRLQCQLEVCRTQLFLAQQCS